MRIVNPQSQAQPQVTYTWDGANRLLGVAQGGPLTGAATRW
ncbi:MAG: hypothetical protein ACREQI_07175 [Candidatus Binataceae bacterium]